MNFLKASVRLTLLGILAVLCVAVAVGTGVAKIDSVAERTVAGLESTERTVQLLDTIRTAHIRFKAQVQEWKNVLLRAQEPGASAKYRSRFDLEAAEVDRLLRLADRQMRELAIDPAEAQALIAAHTKLTRQYLDALAQGDPTRAEGARTIDRRVRALDRATSDDFDAAADRLEDHIGRRIDTILTEAKADASSGRFTLIVTGAIGITLALLILLWTTHDLMVQLREAQQGNGEPA